MSPRSGPALLTVLLTLGCSDTEKSGGKDTGSSPAATASTTTTPATSTTGASSTTTPTTPGTTTTTTPSTTPTSTTTTLTGPTYYEDAAHVFAERCVMCHTAGGIGPFPLDEYASAAGWSPLVAAYIEDRLMPPWLVVDDGSCQDFAHSAWLEQDEIDTVVAWADAGAQEGDVAFAPDFDPDPVHLDRVDLSFTTPLFSPEIVGGPFAEFDEYRCFLVDNPSEADQYITGYEVRPSNEAIVHHVLVMPVELAASSWVGGVTNGTMIAILDDADERVGWPCFGTAGAGVREESIPVGWAPGQGPTEYTGNVGLPVAADASYVVQVHYNLANPAHIGSLDQTTIELKTEIEVDRIGWNILHDPLLEDAVYGGGEVLPPGDPAYKYTWSMSGASMLRMGDQSPYEADMQLHGVFPHMHEYGTAMGMDLIRADGSRSCAVEVPRWDFGWQRLYFYEEPLSISPADLVEISCTYDTTAATEPITPGWGTDNEMCLMGMIASVPAR